jgi:hypothetical protein
MLCTHTHIHTHTRTHPHPHPPTHTHSTERHYSGIVLGGQAHELALFWPHQLIFINLGGRDGLSHATGEKQHRIPPP